MLTFIFTLLIIAFIVSCIIAILYISTWAVIVMIAIVVIYYIIDVWINREEPY